MHTHFKDSQSDWWMGRSHAADLRCRQRQREMLAALDGLVWRIPPRILLATCLVILGIPGLLDHALAGEFSISFFYLTGVGIAAWYGGNLGYWMAVLAALLSLGAGHAHGNAITPYWDAAVRLAFLVVFAHLLAFQCGRLRREARNARIDLVTGARTTAGVFGHRDTVGPRYAPRAHHEPRLPRSGQLQAAE
jgi:hypothetical protein